MNKITFVNNGQPAINDINLNLLQNNIEDAIEDKTTYSTDEKQIGKWIDGKPIYRKVIHYTTRPNSNMVTIAHGISNLDEFTKVDGIYKRLDGKFNIMSRIDEESWIARFDDLDATNIILKFGNNVISSTYWKGIDIILEYTKTTD